MILQSLATSALVLFPVSEGALALFKRAGRDRTQGRDEGSLGVLWGVIAAAITLAMVCRGVAATRIPMSEALRGALTAGLILAGLALRWTAILTLGRFFTVDVAIHEDHRLVQAGPYRLVRHPSYTGALLAFLGLGASCANVLSLAVLMVPIFLAFRSRMAHEERALLAALGEPYRAYRARTCRLVPWVW